MSAAILAIIAMAATDVPPAQSPGQVRRDETVAAAHSGKLRYYPEKAQRAHVNGRAVIDCVIEDGGWLTDCKVASEDPSGWGFGDTALKMAPLFQIKPINGRGPPVGTRRQMPINFKLPG